MRNIGLASLFVTALVLSLSIASVTGWAAESVELETIYPQAKQPVYPLVALDNLDARQPSPELVASLRKLGENTNDHGFVTGPAVCRKQTPRGCEGKLDIFENALASVQAEVFSDRGHDTGELSGEKPSDIRAALNRWMSLDKGLLSALREATYADPPTPKFYKTEPATVIALRAAADDVGQCLQYAATMMQWPCGYADVRARQSVNLALELAGDQFEVARRVVAPSGSDSEVRVVQYDVWNARD